MSTHNADPLLKRSMKILLIALTSTPLGLAALSGCGEDNSMEQAGAAMDEMAEDASDTLDETMGSLGEAAENAREAFNQATEGTSDKP
jgi:hypothetical protein